MFIKIFSYLNFFFLFSKLKQRLSEDYVTNNNNESNLVQRLTASCMENTFMDELQTDQYVISQINKPSSENDFFQKNKINFLE